MQIRFNDQEVKDIVQKYVCETYPVVGGKKLSVEGYIGEIRVEITDKTQEQF